MRSELIDKIQGLKRWLLSRIRTPSAGLRQSQEGFELRRAIWVGFTKSRFWNRLGLVDVEALARVTILLASAFLFARVLLRAGFPSRTEEYAFLATISPLSFWYVVRQNAASLGEVWRNDWGKLAYGIVASITVTGSKVLADQQIRMLLQSNPSLFPSAQQSITLYNIIGLSLGEVGAFILTVMLFRFLKEVTLGYGAMFVDMLDIFSFREALGLSRRPRPFGNMISNLANTMAYTWAAMFVFSIALSLDSGFSEIAGGGKVFDPTEKLLIWSSFIRNGIGAADSAKVCTNLEPEVLVSPFSTSDPMPKLVVAARPLAAAPDRLGRTYAYRLVACSNPANPASLPTVGRDGGSPSQDVEPPRVTPP